ncbi:CHAD domain-containing protein [Thiohalocapsa sp.]|uniref:CYTH and CHAD domain-containing protein n=1 Tax=Thiohalocapsa sp. TaxID=2497641 RepID=UPI0025CC50A3|nr:CHAD domain-containing protein [Thiohalocapsa sp.]
MNLIAMDYLLPAYADSEQDMDAALMTIRAELRCEPEPAVAFRRRFLDSFEWSLYRADIVLEEITSNGGRELLWQDLTDDGTVLARQTLDTDPGLIADMAPGPVRERLAPLLGVRRLLPMVVLSGSRRTLRVLNDDDKTVARILLEQAHVESADDAPQVALPMRLRLAAVRGYAHETERAAHRLKTSLSLEPARVPLYLEALAAAGRRPGSYSSKLDYRLDPHQPAEAAARTILLGLLDTLQANIDGTRQNLDPEFLHDLRVATRRTRSALSQIKGVLPQAIVDDFKARFAWLQQATGPVRDLDVYLLDFPRLKAQLPPALRDDLDPLRDWLAAHYEAEQEALAEVLDGERFKTLLRDWRAFLEAPDRNGAKDAQSPIKAVANKRIRRMFKRVLEEGRAITDASPPEELHELRKSGKKLRYLMEFFQSLYPPEDIKGLIKQSKVLLDNLGGFQDLAVQAEHLQETAAAMQREDAAPLHTLLAMGALISHILDNQQRARGEFARIFAGFDSAQNAGVFERLFADEKPAVAAPVEAGAEAGA